MIIFEFCIKTETVPPEGEKPLRLHPRKFCGERASVHQEVICHLLAVEGNLKRGAFLPDRLIRQIGDDPAPDGFRSDMTDLPRQIQIFFSHDMKQILHQPEPGAPRLRLNLCDLSDLKKKNH